MAEGLNLARWRQIVGFSQAQWARTLNVTLHVVQQAEGEHDDAVSDATRALIQRIASSEGLPAAVVEAARAVCERLSIRVEDPDWLTPRRVRAIRLLAERSQEALAADLGITTMAISHWETGRSRPNRNREEWLRDLAVKVFASRKHDVSTDTPALCAALDAIVLPAPRVLRLRRATR